MIARKVMVGVPSARLIYTDFAETLADWVWDVPRSSFDVRTNWYVNANRVDLGRSRLIGFAKNWNPDWLIMLDTDMIPEISFLKAMNILDEDRTQGWDVILSPSMSVHGSIMVKPEDGSIPFLDGPFGIEFGSGGFIAMSQRAIAAIQPIGRFATLAPDGVTHYPAFCETSLAGSEDWSLCANLRRIGIRVAADARLRTSHLKAIHLPSMREKTKRSPFEWGNPPHYTPEPSTRTEPSRAERREDVA